MRVALGVEYDGTAFCGWQTQPSGCGVQNHLEAALSHIAGEPIKATCAGRTDAGVHALGQVVHFDTHSHRPRSAWIRGVNASLSSGLAVTWAQAARETFHARYCALSRSYRYVLLNDQVRPAVARERVGWFHFPLDIEAMRAAARLLVGEHDFSAFRSSECQARSPVRTVHAIDIEHRGVYVIFDFRANAFLHHMVRNLIGTLLYVGKRKHAPGWVAEVLASCDRAQAAPTFEAAGLYLTRVEYAAEWLIPAAERLPLVPLLIAAQP